MLRGFIGAFVFVLEAAAMTLAALLCLALALAAFCSCGMESARLRRLDNGRTVLNGLELVPDLPLVVDCNCSDVPCSELVAAGSWWNYAMAGHGATRPVVLVVSGIRRPTKARGCFIEDELPPGIRSEEVASVSDIVQGEWTVAIHGDWIARVQRREWNQAVLRHAIGHALGLDEDPPTTETLDLRSIMQSDAPAWGQVTPRDAALVKGL